MKHSTTVRSLTLLAALLSVGFLSSTSASAQQSGSATKGVTVDVQSFIQVSLASNFSAPGTTVNAAAPTISVTCSKTQSTYTIGAGSGTATIYARSNRSATLSLALVGGGALTYTSSGFASVDATYVWQGGGTSKSITTGSGSHVIAVTWAQFTTGTGTGNPQNLTYTSSKQIAVTIVGA